jgi:murein DD-endopeptidase MepM/ murein hydrolase activator NlpD
MLLTARPQAASALTTFVVLVAAPLAHGHQASGGLAFERPDVTALKCGTGDQTSCPRGQVLRLSGEGLARTRKVVFLGGRGKRDDRAAKPTEKSPHRVIVAVPLSARSGPVRVVTASAASATAPELRVLPGAAPAALPPAPAGDGGGVFPVQGAHDYGTEVNTFGGGRGHKGQDVFARCGTPLVAALGGEVTIAKFQQRAGNYVVIKADDGTSQAYMHLRAPATVAKGARVEAGQPIGEVGDTGRASGCHLHFELWTSPGWYEGGEPIDPLPFLRRLVRRR